MKFSLVIMVMLYAGVLGSGLFSSQLLGNAPGAVAIAAEQPVAGDGWRADFDEVCRKTQEAMTLSKDELQALIARCDALKPRLETLEESARKVALKRLEMARKLFQYTLESK